MSLFRKLSKFREKSLFEYGEFFDICWAKLLGRFLYPRLFGAFGGGSWMRKHSKIVNPGQIFIGRGVSLDKDCVLYSVRSYSGVTYNGKIVVGDGVTANKGLNLTAAESIEIGKEVTFGPNVFVTDLEHDYSDPGSGMTQTRLVLKGPIQIGDRCFLGANVFVSGGVTLGEHCVVGANSVVTKSFPAYSVVTGNPAKLVKVQKPEEGSIE